MYNIWEDKDNIKVKNIFPSELPTFNTVNLYPTAYFATWAVLKKSPNRDEAIDFLLALNQPEIADSWVQYTKSPTGIKGRMSDANFGTDAFEAFTNYIGNNYSENNYNFSEELSMYIIGENSTANTYYKEVIEGKITADEAMRLIRENINLN